LPVPLWQELINRCKEELTSWARIKHDKKNESITLNTQMEKKRKLDKDPDVSTAEGWMRDALKLADEVLDAGEGELVGMSDFNAVEYMVCPLSLSSLPSSHPPLRDVTPRSLLFKVVQSLICRSTHYINPPT
jgi:hypothetical protein